MQGSELKCLQTSIGKWLDKDQSILRNNDDDRTTAAWSIRSKCPASDNRRVASLGITVSCPLGQGKQQQQQFNLDALSTRRCRQQPALCSALPTALTYAKAAKIVADWPNNPNEVSPGGSPAHWQCVEIRTYSAEGRRPTAESCPPTWTSHVRSRIPK